MAIDTPDFLQLAQLASPSDLGALVIANGQAGVTLAVIPSPFATAIVVIPYASYDLVDFSVEGAISRNTYARARAITLPLPLVVAPIAGAADTPVNVSASAHSTNTSGGPYTVGHVYQLFGTGVQQVVNTPAQPLSAKLMAGTPDIGAVDIQTAGTTFNAVAGGSGTLIAGVLDQQIIIYGYDLGVSPAGATAGSYQVVGEDTTAAVQFWRGRITQETIAGVANVRSSLWIAHGLPLPISAGLQMVALAANPGNILVEGVVFYAQLLVTP